MSVEIIAQNSGKTFKQAPAGNFVARCFQMVHYGTVEENFQGQTKKLNKVRISWELPTELEDFGKGVDQPHVISKDFTLSMNEKATLRKFLESWRGKAFTEAEANKFDVAKLIGAPCQLQIIKKQSKAGREYSDISSIATLVKGVVCPATINPTLIFSVNSFDVEVFKTLPEFIQEKIKSSDEYKKLQLPQETVAETNYQESDDLPF